MNRKRLQMKETKERLLESAEVFIGALTQYISETDKTISDLRGEVGALRNKNADIAALFESTAELLRRG